MKATDRHCQYESKLRPDYRCQQPALPGGKYCIFHEKEKDAVLFQRRIKEKIKNGDYDFTGFYFPEFTSFARVTFEETALFVEATFEGKGRAFFLEAIFQGHADFEEATFKGIADFYGATFKFDAVFRGATFKGSADFKGVTFEAGAYFEWADFRRVADFRKAAFKYPEFKEIACRLSKISYQKEGQYDKAGDSYYEERVARWQDLKWRSFKSFPKKLAELIFLRLTCGYGERPHYVFGWAFGIITLFAILYCQIGHIVSNSSNHIFGIGDAFYFSVTTFVTLGFGGPWYPSPDHWIKYLVMSEAFSGAFFIALFVMTFGRRMMR